MFEKDASHAAAPLRRPDRLMLARPEYYGLADDAAGSRHATFERVVRHGSIRWRILAIAVFNSVLALILLALIWNGARVLNDAWRDLQRVRQSERFLATLDSDAQRLQSLIHRYIAQNDPDVHARIIDLNENLISRLRVQARLDPVISAPTRPLMETTERFIAGFDDLRDARADISRVHDVKILGPTREMPALFAQLAVELRGEQSAQTAALEAAREAYNGMTLAANAFYLSGSEVTAREAKAHAERIAADVQAIADDTDASPSARRAYAKLRAAAATVAEGLNELTAGFGVQRRLLREAIDGNTAAMSSTIDTITARIHDLEQSAQNRFDATLRDVGLRLALLAVAFFALVVLMSLQIARSISEPLASLRGSMQSITSGDLLRPVGGLEARDEIGEMARAVEIFRQNAIAKQRAEGELRQAKDSAETALSELKDTQTNLIAAEKFAALGGLVAGVAHEINNPVGISLTVASSLKDRCQAFGQDIGSGQIRRSRLEDFVRSANDAADQLVANLMRAGELVQSFKQVAVDRSQGERRPFELAEAVEQILSSVKPTLKSSQVSVCVDVPAGIRMNSYPGPLGQIVTNLFLNALHHAFPGGEPGAIRVEARRKGDREVEITFQDDGRGMSAEVRRCAFDPFFTTRRGLGGTGLGLHIVHNLVTARLGGRIALASSPGEGSVFRLTLPLDAPTQAAGGVPIASERSHV